MSQLFRKFRRFQTSANAATAIETDHIRNFILKFGVQWFNNEFIGIKFIYYCMRCRFSTERCLVLNYVLFKILIPANGDSQYCWAAFFACYGTVSMKLWYPAVTQHVFSFCYMWSATLEHMYRRSWKFMDKWFLLINYRKVQFWLDCFKCKYIPCNRADFRVEFRRDLSDLWWRRIKLQNFRGTES